MNTSIENRFWSFVEKTETCWNWKGSVNMNKDPRGGYGRIVINGRIVKAHRYSYVLFKGNIPKGLELDHICRNRRCVNPDHLEAVTHRENVLRGNNPMAKQARITHCKRGHLLSEENIYRHGNKRSCRECQYMRNHGMVTPNNPA